MKTFLDVDRLRAIASHEHFLQIKIFSKDCTLTIQPTKESMQRRKTRNLGNIRTKTAFFFLEPKLGNRYGNKSM